jgi:hypothetical protein
MINPTNSDPCALDVGSVSPIDETANTNTKVAITSAKKFQCNDLIAGPVENVPKITDGSFVAS